VPYIPGSQIYAYCGSCKSDTKHVVLEVEGVQIREVRCKVCSARGEFRATRAKTKAGLQEAIKRKSMPPPPRRRAPRKKAETPEEIFNKLVSGRDLSMAEPYSIELPLKVSDIIDHPKFGVGIVIAIADAQKVRVVFEDGERIMVCNRG
jgi:hypothetical protein